MKKCNHTYQKKDIKSQIKVFFDCTNLMRQISMEFAIHLHSLTCHFLNILL
jgi:hypothetical protein